MTMGGSVFLYLILLQKTNLIVSTYAALAVAAFSVTFFEFFTPYKKEWMPNKSDIKNDMLFMVLVQLLFSKFLVFFTAVVLLKVVKHFGIAFEGIWPDQLPVLWQGVLMVLIIDFFRYWLHRASHSNKYLWSLHAVHHSPKKLYWINVGRFHPIERSLQFLIDSFPFMLIGVKEEVLGMYFLFFAVNGFFQHCNILLKYGYLNYVFSSAELHRWHHSRKIEESNSNFSNTTIIWDVLFQTWFLPKQKEVGELGLFNENYPLDFSSQMKTPFLFNLNKQDLPILSFGDIFINWLLSVRMKVIEKTTYKQLKKEAKDPMFYQNSFLNNLIRINTLTTFGRKHGFEKIKSYADFKKELPIQNYEDIRHYLNIEEKENQSYLTSEKPILYNQTSGTTGRPKYIPLLKSSLWRYKKAQNIFSYIQYRNFEEGFYGKLLGLVSPAVEGFLPNGVPYGSASGLIYKNMPAIAQAKYVVPYEVFEILDYNIKYYLIMRFALAEKEITYLGSANPTTFLKMQEVATSKKEELIEDIKLGRIRYKEHLEPKTVAKLFKKIKPNQKRADELKAIFQAKQEEVSFSDFWPYLKIITTWTGGSCKIALNKAKCLFPEESKIFELGYLSSEVRGTITIDGESNRGVLTFQDNFFEFCEKEKWEDGDQELLTLNQIKPGNEYYIFVTTSSGLYRYHMNDIIKVTGFFENTPTIQFIQKGKGVVNITGEKLYESQVLSALAHIEKEFDIHTTFFQILGNEETFQYEMYLEADLLSNILLKSVETAFDNYLCELNLEYKAKRHGGRLNPLKLHMLKKGTFEIYKTSCLDNGQKEGQFKTVSLVPKKDFTFSFDAYLQ